MPVIFVTVEEARTRMWRRVVGVQKLRPGSQSPACEGRIWKNMENEI